MSLASEITKVAQADPTGDPTALATNLLRRLTKADLTALLAEEIAHQQRGVHAAAEASAFADKFTETVRSGGLLRRSPSVPVPTDQFRALFDSPFKLGDGTAVVWGEATVEQHEQRITFLSKLRDGLDRTIDRHREAIAAIRSAGVSCLAEIGVEEAVAA